MWESRIRFPSLALARRHLQASYAGAAATKIGGRYASFLAGTAQDIRASLFAKACGPQKFRLPLRVSNSESGHEEATISSPSSWVSVQVRLECSESTPTSNASIRQILSCSTIFHSRSL